MAKAAPKVGFESWSKGSENSLNGGRVGAKMQSWLSISSSSSLVCGSAIVVCCFVEWVFSWVGALRLLVPVRPFVYEMGESDRKLYYFSIKLLHFCAKPVELLEWWVDVFIASSGGEAKVREKWMKLVHFVAQSGRGKEKAPHRGGCEA